MFFALTDEQRALGDTVRDFLADRFDLTAVRAVFEDAAGDGHPTELWKAVGEQGWLAVCVPEEYDGLGLGILDAHVVARALGAGVVPGPWLSTVLAGEAVRLAGSEAQRADLLPRIADGDLAATVALRGAGRGWGADGVTVSAVPVAGEPAAEAGGELGALTGAASPVEYLAVAGLVVVAATESSTAAGAAGAGAGSATGSGGVGLYLVDPQAAGVTVEPLTSYDGTTRLAALKLEGAHARRLPGSSAAVLEDLVRRGAVLTAADLAGIAREALTRTVRYDQERIQFGRPVGSFQALKHHLADLHVAVTMAEHAAMYAAYAIDAELDDLLLAVAVAKAKASQAARDATAAMIQYHGGIGYTWEHETHFFYKRARRLYGAFGDPPSHLERVAALTIDTVAAPDSEAAAV
ncbi:acyl-CoA dehydrogenase [Parafrankia colletiae]|uniref:Acyl-CoA dehydrogenase n=1 Tax=Parafrankia colletiae TaxID=573497 RepID=A0A1S1QJG5_9ACTN|nr:acyl-CoA dehydrogenase family protein [Parafrankia colletiae]MCK9898772.1 acyl-CoA/acyl-ACP dehydrogenase [Frankia sp. Cpl3]OHV33746.1 acyl-CoA dehydrogenase [Parafrankia colletiae]